MLDVAVLTAQYHSNDPSIDVANIIDVAVLSKSCARTVPLCNAMSAAATKNYYFRRATECLKPRALCKETAMAQRLQMRAAKVICEARC
jgi:hypothetical protein